MSDLSSQMVVPLLLAFSLLLAGCTGGENQAPMQTPSPAPEGMPGVIITSPTNGAVLPAGNITVSVRAENFRLVPSYGQAAVQGEGHLHYYMDMPVPVPSGMTAPPGHFVPIVATSYTFRDVPPGTHNFSVELANNDHAPFPKPIFSTVTVAVTGQLPSTATVTTTGGGADAKSCIADSNCVPEQCCHPTSCINRAFKGVCTVLCTNVCSGPIDCGAGHCSCINGRCGVAPGAAAATP
jgi:hypothetical protein